MIGRWPGYVQSGSHAGGRVGQPYSPCLTPRRDTRTGRSPSSRYGSVSHSPSRSPISSPLLRAPEPPQLSGRLAGRPTAITKSQPGHFPQSPVSDAIEAQSPRNITPMSVKGGVPEFPVSSRASPESMHRTVFPKFAPSASQGKLLHERSTRMVARSPSRGSSSIVPSSSESHLLNEVVRLGSKVQNVQDHDMKRGVYDSPMLTGVVRRRSKEQEPYDKTQSGLRQKLEEFENHRSRDTGDQDAEVQASIAVSEKRSLKKNVQHERETQKLQQEILDLKEEILNLNAALKEERSLKSKALAAEMAAIEAAVVAKQQADEDARANATAAKEREERIAGQSKRDAVTIKEQQDCIALLEGELRTLLDRNSDMQRQIDSLNDAAGAAQKKSVVVAERSGTKDDAHAPLEQQVASSKYRLEEAIEERDELAIQLKRQRDEFQEHLAARQEAHARWLAASQESQKVADQRIEALEQELCDSKKTAAECTARDRERIKQLEQQVLGCLAAQRDNAATAETTDW